MSTIFQSFLVGCLVFLFRSKTPSTPASCSSFESIVSWGMVGSRSPLRAGRGGRTGTTVLPLLGRTEQRDHEKFHSWDCLWPGDLLNWHFWTQDLVKTTLPSPRDVPLKVPCSMGWQLLPDALKGNRGQALSWCPRILGPEETTRASGELTLQTRTRWGLDRCHLPMATWKFHFTYLLTAVLGCFRIVLLLMK